MSPCKLIHFHYEYENTEPNACASLHILCNPDECVKGSLNSCAATGHHTLIRESPWIEMQHFVEHPWSLKVEINARLDKPILVQLWMQPGGKTVLFFYYKLLFLWQNIDLLAIWLLLATMNTGIVTFSQSAIFFAFTSC